MKIAPGYVDGISAFDGPLSEAERALEDAIDVLRLARRRAETDPAYVTGACVAIIVYARTASAKAQEAASEYQRIMHTSPSRPTTH